MIGRRRMTRKLSSPKNVPSTDLSKILRMRSNSMAGGKLKALMVGRLSDHTQVKRSALKQFVIGKFQHV
jgi:hypothetical protein